MMINKESNSGSILRAEGLKKNLNGFNLDIPCLDFLEGKIYGLTGPNGSGKTTLLSILNFIERPDSGKLFYRRQEISGKNSHTISIRRKMAMVLENPYLFNTSVVKNVAYGLRARQSGRKNLYTKAKEALSLVNLGGFEDRKAKELSRGETQRVAIARAIVLRPEILFLDEPFTNIDKIHIGVIEKLIKDINRKKNTTIIFTSHDLFQAYRLSDEIVSIVNGRLVKGSIENLFAGVIKERGNSKWVEIPHGLKVEVATEIEGKVHILIPPEDIILSRKPFESSARNVLQGMIKRIEIEEDTVRVCCDTGSEFIALITKASFDRMRLSIGSPVFLTFKTTSVKVF